MEGQTWMTKTADLFLLQLVTAHEYHTAKLPEIWLFVQQFVQIKIILVKTTSKFHITGPLWREFSSRQWIIRT